MANIKPYRNTLISWLYGGSALHLWDSPCVQLPGILFTVECVFIWRTHCRQDFETCKWAFNSTGPITGLCLTIPSLRVHRVINPDSGRVITPVVPYRNTLLFYNKLRSWVSAQDPIGLPMFSNVFLYGRAPRYCPVFFWLKARYFTLKFEPRIWSMLRDSNSVPPVKSRLLHH